MTAKGMAKAGSPEQLVTAEAMAREGKVSAKRFRRALREDRACQGWHRRYERWEVERGKGEHRDMVRVLRGICP